MYIQDKTIFTCIYSIINGSYNFVLGHYSLDPLFYYKFFVWCYNPGNLGQIKLTKCIAYKKSTHWDSLYINNTHNTSSALMFIFEQQKLRKYLAKQSKLTKKKICAKSAVTFSNRRYWWYTICGIGLTVYFMISQCWSGWWGREWNSSKAREESRPESNSNSRLLGCS